MNSRAFGLCFFATSAFLPMSAFGGEPEKLSGAFKPSWSATSDLQLSLELSGADAQGFEISAAAVIARVASHISPPTFLDEPLKVTVDAENATILFGTGTAKPRWMKSGFVACIDAWYGTLTGPRKLELDAVVAGAPGGTQAVARELSTSLTNFVSAQNADCGTATPTRLNDSLQVDVPRYVSLKVAGAAIGDLAALDSVLGEAWLSIKNEKERKFTSEALIAAQLWATQLRTFGFKAENLPAVAPLFSQQRSSAPGAAPVRSRSSVVLDVLRATTSPDIAKASLASGDFSALRPSLTLADSLLERCSNETGRWDFVRCDASRLATDFRWLELRSNGTIASFLLPASSRSGQ